MWLETELGGYVQLSHVAQLVPVYYGDQRGGAVQVVLTSGIEQVVDFGFASEEEAREAVRSVLHLARLADQGLWGRSGDLITLEQALAQGRRLAEREGRLQPSPPRAPAPPPLPEASAPGRLSEAEVERADAVLADAAEHARAINAGAAAAPGQGSRPATTSAS
jgi:hypothetical protein